MSRTGISATGSPVTSMTAELDLLSRAATIAGLFGVALIHLLDLPSKAKETPYQAILFGGVVVVALLEADWLKRSGDLRAWVGAAVLCTLVLAGFVVSRTIGLPGAPADDIGNWSEPLGMASLFIEATVVWLSLSAIMRARAARAAG
jgi:hypothetical protein